MRAIPTLLLLLPLCGCAGTIAPPPAAGPVCEALIGPIRYNSRNKDSARHAGPALAPELAQRNAVGTNLHCPQWRRR